MVEWTEITYIGIFSNFRYKSIAAAFSLLFVMFLFLVVFLVVFLLVCRRLSLTLLLRLLLRLRSRSITLLCRLFSEERP